MSTAPDSTPRFTGIVHWRHRLGPAHCLVRAAYLSEVRQATVLVSELESNPDDRGITADFGKVADAILPVLREIFPADLQRIVWIAHFGDFSYHDPAGPETFTRIALSTGRDGFTDDLAGDQRLERADIGRLLGDWRLRPVPEVLSDLGHEQS
ncbi:hypothetical protein NE236_32385 [Actinoallomurus purpureus]|uniref:hypothetical protein n=1 Tax=Actinoallomurus purpureus TaxID=478114 RepID=UPI002093B8E9|nr:hypothetical protein [Actinoallomurus purpureus]MCO6009680.1 hypothetical protein [Actinoallomurus purpureus]